MVEMEIRVKVRATVVKDRQGEGDEQVKGLSRRDVEARIPAVVRDLLTRAGGAFTRRYGDGSEIRFKIGRPRAGKEA